MSCPDRVKVCEAARLIDRLSSPQRGGIPAFGPYHIVQALRLMRSQPTGRPHLVRLLGVGEATARTIIYRLEVALLAERRGRGRMTTYRGDVLLDTIDSAIRVLEWGDELLGEPAKTVLVLCVPPPTRLIDVYRIRDYAVMRSCRKVVVGGISGGKLLFPGIPESLTPTTPLPEEPEEGVLILGPASCLPALYAAGLNVLLEACEAG